jgi:hypothetical protein
MRLLDEILRSPRLPQNDIFTKLFQFGLRFGKLAA